MPIYSRPVEDTVLRRIDLFRIINKRMSTLPAGNPLRTVLTAERNEMLQDYTYTPERLP